jgi:hypothetical protein
MIKTLTIAAVLASSVYAAALAEGEYFEGADRTAAIDRTVTGSIPKAPVETDKQSQQKVGSGDYYPGASRPN